MGIGEVVVVPSRLFELMVVVMVVAVIFNDGDELARGKSLPNVNSPDKEEEDGRGAEAKNDEG